MCAQSLCVQLFETPWTVTHQVPLSMECGRCVFNFLRHCQDVFLNGCTILHSFWLCVRVPVPPHFHQHLVWSVFSIWVILIDMQWRSSVLFTCISLKTKTYWVFLKVLTCDLYVFHKIVHIFHIFLLDYFLILEFWEYFVYYDYQYFIRYVIYRCFLWVSGLSLHSYNIFQSFKVSNKTSLSIFQRLEVLNFDEGQCINLMYLMDFPLRYDTVSEKSLPNPHSQRFSPIFILEVVYFDMYV